MRANTSKKPVFLCATLILSFLFGSACATPPSPSGRGVPISADLNHALKQRQLALERVALADFQALVTVASEVGRSGDGDDARSQRMTFEGFQALDFGIDDFVLRSKLGDVAIIWMVL